jgi:hypothetical protein
VLAILGAPVGVAAIVVREDGRAVVRYPGLAGLVEHELAPAIGAAVRSELPPLVPEVEAVICSALQGGIGAWLVGIDVVFALAGEPHLARAEHAAIERAIATLEVR